MMNIMVEWDDPQKTILLYRFASGWTWEDFFEAQRQRRPMLQGITHRVHHLLIFEEHGKFPGGFIFNAGSWDRQRFAYSGVYAVVGAPRFIKLIVTTLRRLDNSMAKETRFFESENAARAYLRRLLGLDEAEAALTD